MKEISYRNTFKDVIVSLFTQINFKHVSKLGNLTLEILAFFEVKFLGMWEPLEFSFQEITFIFVQGKENLEQSK